MRRVDCHVKVKTSDHAHPFFGEESSAQNIYVTRIWKRMKTAGTMGPGELIEDASDSGVAGFFYCRQMSELVRAERREEPLHRPLDGLQIRNDWIVYGNRTCRGKRVDTQHFGKRFQSRDGRYSLPMGRGKQQKQTSTKLRKYTVRFKRKTSNSFTKTHSHLKFLERKRRLEEEENKNLEKKGQNNGREWRLNRKLVGDVQPVENVTVNSSYKKRKNNKNIFPLSLSLSLSHPLTQNTVFKKNTF